MPINPLINDKINSLDIPEKMKKILLEILESEDEMVELAQKKNAVNNIRKILENYGDDAEITEFCSQNE